MTLYPNLTPRPSWQQARDVDAILDRRHSRRTALKTAACVLVGLAFAGVGVMFGWVFLFTD